MTKRLKQFIRSYWEYILIFLLSAVTFLPILYSGYFSHQDDLQVMRILEMRKCFEDGQIPCRWVPDMGYGNGYPLFNYYGVPPYYLGALLSWLFGFIGAAKIIFIFSLLIGGFSMYLLGKELFGKIAGFSCAVLFIFAPYRALDVYVRGDVTEGFAISLIPLVFYFYLKLIKEATLKNLLGSSVSMGVFLTTHNVMSLYFMPVLLIWIMYWLCMQKFKGLKAVLLSLGLGFGTSAYFLLPAFFEKDLVQVDSLTTGPFDFRAHYVTLNQLLFNRSWGYGASVWGPQDGMSFQIGWPQWWLVALAIPLSIVFCFNKGRLNKVSLPIILLLVFLFSVFMTHNKSAFVWERFRLIQFSQFPWRFLSLSIFSASLLGGWVVFVIKKKYSYFILVIILITTIVLNLSFFKVDRYFKLTDQEKLSGDLWAIQQYAGILDYLPKTAFEPNEPAPKNPIVVSGQAEIKDFEKKSNKFAFKARVTKNSNIEIPVLDFPYWKISVNNRDFSHSHDNYLGRIRLDLPPGTYQVKGVFKDTSIRSFANWISLLSIFTLLGLVKFRSKIDLFRNK